MNTIVLAVVFIAASVLSFALIERLIPVFSRIYSKFEAKQERKTTKIAEELEESFIFWEKKKLVLISFSPLILAGIGIILLKNIVGLVIGAIIGLAIPSLMIRMARANRIRKMQGQLVDSLMIISASLKAGLSFVQAIEVLCEEMPPPITQEFKLILKENKWGISLEDSLIGLRKRVPLEEINLLVTSILIARESGGELPRVLSKLTETIRDNIKLKQKIATLTMQGKLQGYIMMVLPIAFTAFIYKQNPDHFTVMLQTSLGRILLIAAVVAQIVGMILIKRISTIRI